MRPHYIQMGLLKILPGTEIAKSTESWEYRYSQTPPYAVFASRWMSAEVLRGYYWLGECIELMVNNRYFVSLWDYLVGGGEDLAAFFKQLTLRFYERGSLWNAMTQEHLSRQLLDQLRGRGDFELCREILCYDWLRCGHRFLPNHLDSQDASLEELRRLLYRTLPERLDGIYDGASRNNFIRKGVFHRFSQQALAILGLSAETDGAIICFMPEREARVFNLQKTILLANSN